jgi:DNA-binding NtrC family response regulator
MNRRVLIVDDDPTVRASLAEALSGEGIEVIVAEDGVRALAAFAAADPALVICDVRMPEMDGLTLLHELRARTQDVAVILMTAYDDMDTVVTAMRAGAVEFLVKPVGFQQLVQLVERVLEDRRLRARAARDGGAFAPAAKLSDLVGRDPRMIALYKLLGQAAATRATVLIRGESGTGKELVARAIHAHSSATAEPFVAVNCAALPTTLLETELFGHVRGAFTGAHESRKGRFALAGRGTIFLDEIGDTSAELQSKLLRVVQDREFQPVGAERTEHTDARVIAATHQPLEAMVTQRRFREDLYYRLRVVEITIPPLRERVDDIPLLAEALVQRAARALDLPVPLLSGDAVERLRTHHWPGNVRELENCLMRAVVLASGTVIRPEHLTLASPTTDDSGEMSSLDHVEREQIVRVLAATRGHKGRSAEILGVSRPRLNRLLQKHGIE